MNDTQNNEPASPLGEGESVTRNVMPMALPPANPFFQFVYSWPINGGQVQLSIPAPGGVVQPRSLATLEKMFELILEGLREEATQHEGTKPSSEPSA